jgi:peptide/nickel transport system ATP-binding protein
MRSLKQQMGLTYLFITHDLATAKYLCDRIAIMYLGRIVEVTTRDELFKSPHHPYTRALLAAVPVPDPKARRNKQLPKGEIPSAIDPPSGCHFHPRCPYAIAKCHEERPLLREVAPGHLSACILD